MSETCKFCGKTGLEWECDKDGDYGLLNPCGTHHSCKNKLKQKYLKTFETRTMMAEYAEESHRLSRQYNSFDNEIGR